MSHKTNIVVSYSSGSIAFIIACDDREKATNRNILLAVNTFFLNLFDEVDSRMVESMGDHTKILVHTPVDVLRLNWTFTDTVSIDQSDDELTFDDDIENPNNWYHSP